MNGLVSAIAERLEVQKNVDSEVRELQRDVEPEAVLVADRRDRAGAQAGVAAAGILEPRAPEMS